MTKKKLKSIIKECLLTEGWTDVLSTMISPGTAAASMARKAGKSDKMKKTYHKFINHIIVNYIEVYSTSDKILNEIYNSSWKARSRFSNVNQFKKEFHKITGNTYYGQTIKNFNDAKQKKFADVLLTFLKLKPEF